MEYIPFIGNGEDESNVVDNGVSEDSWLLGGGETGTWHLDDVCCGGIDSRFLSGSGGVGDFGTFDACSSSDEVILKVVFAAHHITIVSVDCAITQQTLKKCNVIIGQSA